MSEADERSRRWTLRASASTPMTRTARRAVRQRPPHVRRRSTALYGDGDDGADTQAARRARRLGAARRAMAGRYPRVLPRAGRAGDPEGRLRAAQGPAPDADGAGIPRDGRGRRQSRRRPDLAARRDAGEDQGHRADRDRQGRRRADGAAGAARPPRRSAARSTGRSAPTARASPTSTGRAPSGQSSPLPGRAPHHRARRG